MEIEEKTVEDRDIASLLVCLNKMACILFLRARRSLQPGYNRPDGFPVRRHNLAGELSCPDNQTACRPSGGPIKEIGVL